MFGFLLDPLYLLLTGVGLVITLIAQFRVKSTFARFDRVAVRTGMTGAEAAAAVARAGNAGGVRIERHQGFLSDHYDPTSRTLRLSPAVHDGRSISAIAVAAHEAGHAIQHAALYPALGLRSKLVPLANIGNSLWAMPFMLGMFLSGGQEAAGSGTGQLLMQVGIWMFAAVVLFQLVTLPVEFDASRRAKAVLARTGIVSTQEEARGVESVLGAAAMTYVAGALAGVLQLVYLVLRANSRRDSSS
jgi:Zn-dependent membrane protease YugP